MKVFISYRRNDTEAFVGRFHDRLVNEFKKNNVFLDTDGIPAGTDFRNYIKETLQQCDVVITLIGSRWLHKQETGQPIWNDDDFLYLELKAALAEKAITLIPVLVDNATMPEVDQLPEDLKDLHYLQAVPVSTNNQRFHTDMDYLIKQLKQPRKTEASGFPWIKTSAGLVVLLVASAGGKYIYELSNPAEKTIIEPKVKPLKPVIPKKAEKKLPQPPKGYPIIISGMPGDAQVTVDGKPYQADTPLKPATYTVKINSEGYEPIEKKVTITNSEERLSPAFKKIRYTLTIKTHPTNAQIAFLDSKLDYKVGMKLEPRRYPVEIKAKGYKTEQKIIEITSSDKSLSISLGREKLDIEPEMAFIEGGTFTMGCVDGRDDVVEGGCASDEKPAHEVTISGFSMAKTEVTVEQYLACVNDKASKDACPQPEWREKGSEYNSETGTKDLYKKFGDALTNLQNPIVGVSWHDAQKYADWLNKKTGKESEKEKYRLPTEAEWEYAARADLNTTAYSWGNNSGKGNANCWKDQCDDNFDYTSPVASFKANKYGLYDMHGNVWEWVQDWKGEYQSRSVKDPKGASKGTSRVLRGGSWYNFPRSLRSAYRFNYSPDYRLNYLGFRLATGPLQDK